MPLLGALRDTDYIELRQTDLDLEQASVKRIAELRCESARRLGILD